MTIVHPASGVFSKLLIASGLAPYTWDDTVDRFEIIPAPAETFQKHSRLIEARGITGVHQPLKSRVRTGPSLVFGSLRMHPSVGYFQKLLPYLMGAKVSTSYYPGTCLAPFGALFDRDLDIWEYQSGVVDSWELTGFLPKFNEESDSTLLMLTINAIFLAESSPLATVPPTWPSPEPPLPSGHGYAPLSFWDVADTFTLSGSAREIYGFRLKYDNQLDPTLVNSLSLKNLTAPGRRIDLDVLLPWQSNNQGLYDEGIAGATAQLLFTYDNEGEDHSLQFDFHNLKQDQTLSPTAQNYGDVAFEVSGRAYGTVATKEISATVTL